jgi:hypothetical protein
VLLQYLCCEVAALQHQGQLRQLWVFDVAHMAWRLKVAFKLDQALHTPCEQVRPSQASHAASLEALDRFFGVFCIDAGPAILCKWSALKSLHSTLAVFVPKIKHKSQRNMCCTDAGLGWQ